MNGFEPQPMGGPSASQAETWGSFGPSGANPFCYLYSFGPYWRYFSFG